MNLNAWKLGGLLSGLTALISTASAQDFQHRFPQDPAREARVLSVIKKIKNFPQWSFDQDGEVRLYSERPDGSGNIWQSRFTCSLPQNGYERWVNQLAQRNVTTDFEVFVVNPLSEQRKYVVRGTLLNRDLNEWAKNPDAVGQLYNTGSVTYRSKSLGTLQIFTASPLPKPAPVLVGGFASYHGRILTNAEYGELSDLQEGRGDAFLAHLTVPGARDPWNLICIQSVDPLYPIDGPPVKKAVAQNAQSAETATPLQSSSTTEAGCANTLIKK